MMGILALINLLVIALLSPVGRRLLQDYRLQLAKGRDEPRLNSAAFSDLDVDHSAWSGNVSS